MKESFYVIGVDIGTTNTKAVAFTTDGVVLAESHASYAPLSPLPDYHELDPVLLFETAIKTLKEVLAKSSGGSVADPARGPVLAGISFSCAMHSLLVVDASGKPLTHAITWADGRSKEYAAQLKNSDAGKRIYRQTGTPIHPMSPLCKILWLRDQQPAIYAAAGRFVSIKEYIWWRLFGKWLIDFSIASATGLFDIYSLDWCRESLELAGIQPSLLSRPVPCTHLEATLLPEYRNAFGFAGEKPVPFIIGGSDGCMANLGSNAIEPGEAALTIGTSGAIRMMASKPEYDPQERIFNYVLTRYLYVSGGPTNNGGAVVQWYIENFCGAGGSEQGPTDLTKYMDLAAGVEPGADGLIFLPYLFGERAPIWNADARGVFFGIHAHHKQPAFIRSVIEGISYSLYEIGLSLEETIGPIAHISASGGFTRSRFWLQLIADLFNKKVYLTNVADASAIGASITGFYALGLIDGLAGAKKMIHVVETFEPDPVRNQAYLSNFRIFTALYERVRDLYTVSERKGQ